MVSYLNKQNIIIIFIIIYVMLFLESHKIYCYEYEHIGNDSIEIINNMMSYHLYFLKRDYIFEDITFKKRDVYSFKRLYDSLSNLYIPFKKNHIEGDIKAHNDMSGLSAMFTFVVDSNTKYTLWIFIPDEIYRFDELIKSDVKKKLYKLKKFGILAFKETIRINNVDNEYPKKKKNIVDNEFQRALKKLYQRNIKAKSP